MKKSNPFFSILIFLFSIQLFFSCSSETGVEIEEEVVFHSKHIEQPANAANVYDVAGLLHNEILYSYSAEKKPRHGLAAVATCIDSLARASENFRPLMTVAYVSPDLEKIDFILSHKITCVSSIISSTDLSVSAKTSLSNFISAVLAFSDSQEDYALIYDFIIDYETDVIADVRFDSRDKEVLLTLSSVARYSTYAKKKRPKKNMDPDWDILISNIIASTEGSSYGAAEAIIYGLVAGIVENP